MSVQINVCFSEMKEQEKSYFEMIEYCIKNLFEQSNTVQVLMIALIWVLALHLLMNIYRSYEHTENTSINKVWRIIRINVTKKKPSTRWGFSLFYRRKKVRKKTCSSKLLNYTQPRKKHTEWFSVHTKAETEQSNVLSTRLKTHFRIEPHGKTRNLGHKL